MQCNVVREIMAEEADAFIEEAAVVIDPPSSELIEKVFALLDPKLPQYLYGAQIGSDGLLDKVKALFGRIKELFQRAKLSRTFFGSIRFGSTDLAGTGDPLNMPDQRHMEISRSISGFLLDNVFFGFDGRKSEFTSHNKLPLNNFSAEKDCINVTFTVRPEADRFYIPLMLGGVSVDSRVRAVKKDGSQLTLVPDKEHRIDLPEGIEKLHFTLKIPKHAPEAQPISVNEKNRLREEYTEQVKELGKLHEILDEEDLAFCRSVSDFAPHQQLEAVIEHIQAVMGYDLKNKEVTREKYQQNPLQRIETMRRRAKELENRDSAWNGKKLAGICTDSSLYGAALLNKLGFVAGIADGHVISGSEVNAKNCHRLNVVVWPSSGGTGGRVKLVPVDCTPSPPRAAFITPIRLVTGWLNQNTQCDILNFNTALNLRNGALEEEVAKRSGVLLPARDYAILEMAYQISEFCGSRLYSESLEKELRAGSLAMVPNIKNDKFSIHEFCEQLLLRYQSRGYDTPHAVKRLEELIGHLSRGDIALEQQTIQEITLYLSYISGGKMLEGAH
jgi:hypothetical protein